MLQLNKSMLVPDRKVIPAGEYQAYLDAEAIIAEAKNQAEQIIADAHEEFEAQKKEGFEEGLMEAKLEMAEKMVDSVAKSVDYFQGLEAKLTDLVVKALKKVVGEMDQRERIVAVVRNALAVARNEQKVMVRVCPDEVPFLQESLTEIMRAYPTINFIDIVPDGRLNPGGCILETDIGIVDASVDVQLKVIEKSLSKYLTGEG
ncbi:HrpE/YscL family type III secretion apparatus protein [bacterium]|nr:HrpE/YscL family type III secretion apparatus protein [bacterium]